MRSDLPLVVDLDGSLVQTDMLHESAIYYFKHHFAAIGNIPIKLAQGKAQLKQELAKRYDFDPATLPYNLELLAWLQDEYRTGRKIILCTASDYSIAKTIADHLQIFSEVLASDGKLNLAGTNKANFLINKFNLRGFDYVGNSSADLAVWQVANSAIIVSNNSKLLTQAAAHGTISKVIQPSKPTIKNWLRLFRVHQWLKNILLLVPLFAAHRVFEANLYITLLLAFVAFSLCASSVYIANDLFDLASDRCHARKKNRPFAAGIIPLVDGVILIPVLLITSLTIAYLVGKAFFAWVIVYLLLTCAYSWGVKRIILLDCMLLAILYTLRIIAGAAAIHNQLSFWLLAFSLFIFLSLAFIKRYAELELYLQKNMVLPVNRENLANSPDASSKTNKQAIIHPSTSNMGNQLHGRAYLTSDISLIQTMGISAGYAALVVFAFYLNSEAVTKLYQNPQVIWGALLILLFWINWMWLQAHRGKMHDDPVVFAARDQVTWVVVVCFILVLVSGKLAWLQAI